MANDTQNSIDILIERIASYQSRGDKFFPKGIFPSYRQNKYLFYKRPDTNIFYTATIVFILNQIKGKVSEKSKIIIQEITEKAINNYPNFQNKDGLKTYNFWPTNPSNHFSNGLIFKHFKHFKIPDDIDDTALVYLTLPHSKEYTLWLKEKLKQHANLSTRKVVNTFQHYKNLKVYSTWFGKNMPIEFDVCALCNLMYLFQKYKLPYNDYDEAVFTFLQEIILREEYVSDAFKVAHNYATTPLIIYHYARILGDFELQSLEICREKLIQKTKQLLENEPTEMNKLILETALLKLDKTHKPTLNAKISASKPTNFTYFIAGLLSSYENQVLQFFAPMKITQMAWKCDAHDLTLILENMVLKST
ncbi:hypothetical protein EMA8858_03423 [Emticicia aquatica]|uniref:Uncharacterized protein n=1 Tax=Emticicia aquatica TaxID=1681835 RepID=A0ABN8F1I7_9BACT|nr:hypothetical protein [Emticicia aquatica]CAH0997292.1 hypothetical protein EMA8858_03423 [Emticicia aquatica]